MSNKKLPNGYLRIDVFRNAELENTPFNPAMDGMASANRFTVAFAKEIALVKQKFSKFFSKWGEYGSQERYDNRQPSHWWISDDFYSTSRVLFVDSLNPCMQSYSLVHAAQRELGKLPAKWMLLLGHDNMFDDTGACVGKEGKYYFWIRENMVEIYSERETDLEVFYSSIKGLPKGILRV